MLLRRLSIVLAFLMVPAVASADAHRAGAFGGGSFLKASTITGVHVSGEYGPFDHTKFKGVTVLADFSCHFLGKHDGSDDNVKTTLFGGGYEYPIGDHIFTVRGLVGDSIGEGTAKAVGGSWEWVLHRLEPGWQKGFRVQVDHIFLNDIDDAWRISVGGVIRYKRRP
ncbi:MAG TPA: hypothetical protein VH679_03850 [Vicinamibacterales bacterium]|jgi:hypothetical protein